MRTFTVKFLVTSIIILFSILSANGGEIRQMFMGDSPESPLLTGTLTGTVTSCSTGNPMAGVSVACATLIATTNASGVYTINNVPEGIQNVTATSAGFLPYGPTPVTIIANQVNVLNFCMTTLAPYVTTVAASGVSSTTATLNGVVNANGATTTVCFQYGLTVAYGTTAPGVPSVITGSTPCPFSANIVGLTPCTAYHYRAFGVNSYGTSYGNDVTFTPGSSVGSAGPISGPVNVCQGSYGLVYSIAPVLLATGYVWTIPVGWTITSGAISPSVTVTAGPTALSGYICVYPTSSCGNGGSSQLMVTVGSGLPPTISGNNNVCSRTLVTYTTQPGMASYYWGVSPGGTVMSGGGITDNTITISWTLAGSRYVKVSYVSSGGCSSPVTNYPVTVNLSPTPTITGPVSLCNNTTATYMTEAGMTNYIWMVSAGGVITSGAGTRTITVHWVSAGNKTITVNYTNSSGCSAPSPVVKNVTVNALPVPTISGPTSVCLNAYAYYTTEAGMSNYTWTLGGSGGTIYSGFNSRQIQVKWTANGNKTVSVNYTNINGCRAESPSVYNVNVHTCPSPSSPTEKSAEILNLNITVFPDPNDGTFTLSLDFPEKQVCKATVFNLTGVKVYESESFLVEGITEQKIDLENVPAGIYMVIIQSRETCMTRKILVVH